MNGVDINPNWGKETAIEFSVKADNFVYDVAPPLSDIENRALIASGLMLGASVDGSRIDPDGECITEPFAMENYGSNESGESIPVSSSLKLAGESMPEKRVRDLQRIGGALGVMRGAHVGIDFDREAKIASGYLRIPEDEENIEDSKTSELSADFDAYAREQIARFNGLSDFLTDSLTIVEDLGRTNEALEAADRPDLAIEEHAEMMSAETLVEFFERSGNFTPGFYMYSERKGEFAESTYLPMTHDEILSLRDLPKIGSHDELKELEKSRDIKLPRNAYLTHVVHPAFLRMLVLFPDFTTDLVNRISRPENRHRELRLEPELFVAYQLMSRLVDIRDRGAMEEEGKKSDQWHLCH